MKKLLLGSLLLVSITSITYAKVCVELSDKGSLRIESVLEAKRLASDRGLRLEVNPYLKTELMPKLVATLKACFEKVERDNQGADYIFSAIKLDNTPGTRVWVKDRELSSGPTSIENCYIQIVTKGLIEY